MNSMFKKTRRKAEKSTLGLDVDIQWDKGFHLKKNCDNSIIRRKKEVSQQPIGSVNKLVSNFCSEHNWNSDFNNSSNNQFKTKEEGQTQTQANAPKQAVHHCNANDVNENGNGNVPVNQLLTQKMRNFRSETKKWNHAFINSNNKCKALGVQTHARNDNHGKGKLNLSVNLNVPVNKLINKEMQKLRSEMKNFDDPLSNSRNKLKAQERQWQAQSEPLMMQHLEQTYNNSKIKSNGNVPVNQLLSEKVRNLRSETKKWNHAFVHTNNNLKVQEGQASTQDVNDLKKSEKNGSCDGNILVNPLLTKNVRNFRLESKKWNNAFSHSNAKSKAPALTQSTSSHRCGETNNDSGKGNVSVNQLLTKKVNNFRSETQKWNHAFTHSKNKSKLSEDKQAKSQLQPKPSDSNVKFNDNIPVNQLLMEKVHNFRTETKKWNHAFTKPNDRVKPEEFRKEAKPSDDCRRRDNKANGNDNNPLNQLINAKICNVRADTIKWNHAFDKSNLESKRRGVIPGGCSDNNNKTEISKRNSTGNQLLKEKTRNFRSELKKWNSVVNKKDIRISTQEGRRQTSHLHEDSEKKEHENVLLNKLLNEKMNKFRLDTKKWNNAFNDSDKEKSKSQEEQTQDQPKSKAATHFSGSNNNCNESENDQSKELLNEKMRNLRLETKQWKSTFNNSQVLGKQEKAKAEHYCGRRHSIDSHNASVNSLFNDKVRTFGGRLQNPMSRFDPSSLGDKSRGDNSKGHNRISRTLKNDDAICLEKRHSSTCLPSGCKETRLTPNPISLPSSRYVKTSSTRSLGSVYDDNYLKEANKQSKSNNNNLPLRQPPQSNSLQMLEIDTKKQSPGKSEMDCTASTESETESSWTSSEDESVTHDIEQRKEQKDERDAETRVKAFVLASRTIQAWQSYVYERKQNNEKKNCMSNHELVKNVTFPNDYDKLQQVIEYNQQFDPALAILSPEFAYCHEENNHELFSKDSYKHWVEDDGIEEEFIPWYKMAELLKDDAVTVACKQIVLGDDAVVDNEHDVDISDASPPLDPKVRKLMCMVITFALKLKNRRLYKYSKNAHPSCNNDSKLRFLRSAMRSPKDWSIEMKQSDSCSIKKSTEENGGNSSEAVDETSPFLSSSLRSGTDQIIDHKITSKKKIKKVKKKTKSCDESPLADSAVEEGTQKVKKRKKKKVAAVDDSLPVDIEAASSKKKGKKKTEKNDEDITDADAPAADCKPESKKKTKKKSIKKSAEEDTTEDIANDSTANLKVKTKKKKDPVNSAGDTAADDVPKKKESKKKVATADGLATLKKDKVSKKKLALDGDLPVLKKKLSKKVVDGTAKKKKKKKLPGEIASHLQSSLRSK